MENLTLKRWGLAWLVIGTIAAVAALMNFNRDGLLLITLGFLIFSSAAAAYVSNDLSKSVTQLMLGGTLVVVATAVFMNLSLSPMSAIPVWLGLIAGSANFFAGQRLSPLALLGQVVPIATIAVTNMTRQDLSGWGAIASLSSAFFFCVLGSLLARLRSASAAQ